MTKIYDALIIGGGQAGLSVAYFLRRKEVDFLVLDDREQAGGAWHDTWESLRLFSPRQYSSLSGWPMPPTAEEYPTKEEFIEYLEAYEERYQFPICRPVEVFAVKREGQYFVIETTEGVFRTRSVVAATGTAAGAYIPHVQGRADYQGEQLHSIDYRSPFDFIGKKVLVVGSGNSGAQILAEVSQYTYAQWATLRPPVFLPEEVDGRYLFQRANEQYRALQAGRLLSDQTTSLSKIVMVPPVQEAKKQGRLLARVEPFTLTCNGVVWANSERETFDTVIWCTGFRPDLSFLEPMGIIYQGRIRTRQTRALDAPGLWLVGYGAWTGFASDTIYGVGKTAKTTAAELAAYLEERLPATR